MLDETTSINNLDSKEELNKNIDKQSDTNNKKKRVFEIDIIRGFIIILMVIDHLMWSISSFVYKFFDCRVLFSSVNYFTSIPNVNGITVPSFLLSYMNAGHWYYSEIPIRWAIRFVVLLLFFVISGISFTFSRNNLKRGLVLLGFGAIITIFTYILAYTDIISYRYSAISFGVLSCYGALILITYFVRKLTLKLSKNNIKAWYIVSFSLIILSLFIYMLIKEYDYNYIPDKNDPLSVFIGFIGSIIGFAKFGGDFFPIFPYLSYFLIGELIGETIYKNKESLFKKEPKVLKPLSFIGSHTLWIYLLHIPIITLFHAILYWASGFHLSF